MRLRSSYKIKATVKRMANDVSVCTSNQYQDLSTTSLSHKSVDRQKQCHHVVFSDVDPDVKEVKIDEDELKDRWYSNGEYFFIRKEAKSTVRRMATTRIEESDTLSTRGLEIVDDAKEKQRKKVVKEAIRCVLDEQSKKGSSPNFLATVYHNIAHESTIISIENGANDAREAEHILEDARESWYPDSKEKTNNARRWKPRTPRMLKGLAKKIKNSNR